MTTSHFAPFSLSSQHKYEHDFDKKMVGIARDISSYQMRHLAKICTSRSSTIKI